MPDNHASAQRAIHSLLHPTTIALIGASPRLGFASSLQRVITIGNYPGKLYGVNPNYTDVLGVPCFPSISEIPEPVDLAIVVVRSDLVFDVLEQCEQARVGAVNIISSGFAEKPGEETGAHRQRRLRDWTQRTGIRVVGPNCLGNISVPAGMVAMSGPYDRAIPRGPIAAVFQSGLLTYSLIEPCIDRNIGFTYVVTTGNEADLDLADFVRYYVDDDETRVIACMVEQFRNPRKFLEAADYAAERKKPIVVLKIGRSEAGRRSALAHTGSLVGTDEIAAAVMRQHGIVRVYGMDEMIETLAIMHAPRLPTGNGIASVFISGGAAGLFADLAADAGLNHPDLTATTLARISNQIPAYGTPGNPLDATGQVWAMPGAFRTVLEAVAEDPSINIVVNGRALPARVNVENETGQLIRDLPEQYPDTTFLFMSLVAGRHRDREYFEEAEGEYTDAIGGIPFLQGTENTVRAIAALIRYAEFQRERGTLPPKTETPPEIVERARQLILAAGGKPLVERQAKHVLALYGIPVTSEHLADSAEDAAEAATRIGYPVALKVESPDVLHKTEAGAILLDLASATDVRRGYETVIANVRLHNPDATIAGVLVQEMVPLSHEIMLGMTQDADFGPAVAVGLGGIFVETLRDVALGVPPLTNHDAHAMLARLRAKPLLDGAGSRGRPPADLDELARVIIAFGRLCHDLRDLVSEIDINPLMLFDAGQGSKVVDCLIIPSTTGDLRPHSH